MLPEETLVIIDKFDEANLSRSRSSFGKNIEDNSLTGLVSGIRMQLKIVLIIDDYIIIIFSIRINDVESV